MLSILCFFMAPISVPIPDIYTSDPINKMSDPKDDGLRMPYPLAGKKKKKKKKKGKK